ncbi:hypothetical protein L210DRAFT_3559002 [Boletus edulis BED1]|uniref:Uncharacterized protein n=1 Tax=Boletus edulis BED1 TaxID=1328754 RepID=A0AAD4BIZ2_BOLED|nr:hypothetical protein L210DRAFT_3559002 [Boletus edulis BED1]
MALSSSARGAELPRPQTDALAPVARSCASKRYSILPEVSQTGRETDRVPHLDVWTLVCCTRAIDRLKYLSLHPRREHQAEPRDLCRKERER